MEGVSDGINGITALLPYIICLYHHFPTHNYPIILYHTKEELATQSYGVHMGVFFVFDARMKRGTTPRGRKEREETK